MDFIKKIVLVLPFLVYSSLGICSAPAPQTGFTLTPLEDNKCRTVTAATIGLDQETRTKLFQSLVNNGTTPQEAKETVVICKDNNHYANAGGGVFWGGKYYYRNSDR